MYGKLSRTKNPLQSEGFDVISSFERLQKKCLNIPHIHEILVLNTTLYVQSNFENSNIYK